MRNHDRFIDEPDCELTLIDKQSYEDWARGVYASPVTEKSEEETLKERKVKFESLPDDLRDLAGMYYLQDNTQAEIAQILGISQPAVSKRLGKIEAILKAMPETAGTR